MNTQSRSEAGERHATMNAHPRERLQVGSGVHSPRTRAHRCRVAVTCYEALHARVIPARRVAEIANRHTELLFQSGLAAHQFPLVACKGNRSHFYVAHSMRLKLHQTARLHLPHLIPREVTTRAHLARDDERGSLEAILHEHRVSGSVQVL